MLQVKATVFLTVQWTIYILISFSCLIAVARASSTVLSRNSESQHMCLIPYLRTKTFCIKCDIRCKSSRFFRHWFSDLQLGERKPGCWCFGYWMAKGSWRPQFSVCRIPYFPRSLLLTALLSLLFTVGLGPSVRGSVSPQSKPPVQLLLAWKNAGPLASQDWVWGP